MLFLKHQPFAPEAMPDKHLLSRLTMGRPAKSCFWNSPGIFARFVGCRRP